MAMNSLSPSLKESRRHHALAVALLGIMVLLAVCMMMAGRHEDFVIPNEKEVAISELAKKFDASGYFHASAENRCSMPGEVELFITASSAREQEKRVAAERGFTPESAARLHQLVQKLTEQAPSRLYNERVNVLKLDLALDEMK